MVQLRGEKSLVRLASAEALILDVVDDDGSIVVDLVKDRFIKLHCDDVDPWLLVSSLHLLSSVC